MGDEQVLSKFAYQELLGFKSRMEGERRQRSEACGMYQDFLRALGHELEQVPGYEILLEELEEGFLLTYQYLLQSEGYQPRKQMAVIAAEEREDILTRARGRRSSGEKRGIFSILGPH